MNVSDKAVSKWESEGGFPEITQLPVLAKIFDVSIDYLMTGKETEPEIITMSKIELCAKNDDVSLVKDINLTTKDENGSLPFSICSTTIRADGEIHKHFYTEEEIDYYALYSSTTDEVYLLSVKEAPNRKVTIRYKEPYASTSKRAQDYLIEKILATPITYK